MERMPLGKSAAREGEQIRKLFRERVARAIGPAQSQGGSGIDARCAADPQVDAAWKDGFECQKIFRDFERGMVWEHDATRPDP